MTILAIAFYIFNNYWKEFDELFRKIDNKFIYILFLSQSILIATTGLPFKTIYEALDIKINTIDWICLSYAGNFANYTAPLRPGLAVRYLYMKKHYKSTLTDIAIVTAVYSFYTITVAFGLTLVFMLLNAPLPHKISYLPLFILICVVLSILYLNKILSVERILKNIPQRIAAIIENVQSFRHKPRLTIQLTCQFLLINLIGGITYYFAFEALSITPKITTILMITPLSTLTGWFALTPANIGVTETLVGLLLEYSSGEFSVGFIATSVVRLSHVGVSVILGGLSSAYILKRSSIQ